MSKPNPKRHLLYKWKRELGEECFEPVGGFMHCSQCNKLVTANRRMQLVHHLISSSHMKSQLLSTQFSTFEAERNVEPDGFVDNVDGIDSRTVVNEATDEKTFNLDLCAALRAAGIPLCALNSAELRAFLGKYTGRSIPNEQFMLSQFNL